jgi:hypothetical protein
MGEGMAAVRCHGPLQGRGIGHGAQPGRQPGHRVVLQRLAQGHRLDVDAGRAQAVHRQHQRHLAMGLGLDHRGRQWTEVGGPTVE